MQDDDVQSDNVWRWRPDAMSSEEPHTASSLDPRGGGEAFMARQVGRRSCGAKAAVRRDELGGASMQPNTAVLQRATRVCRPCFSGTRAWAKEGLAHEQMDPGGSRRSCPSKPIRLCRFVPGVHDIQHLLFLVDRRARPQVTAGITPSTIFHLRQPSPTNFFVTHRISSPSSTSRHQSYSPREFTFRVFSFITKATPRFAPIH
jgi:hypothetical protein